MLRVEVSRKDGGVQGSVGERHPFNRKRLFVSLDPTGTAQYRPPSSTEASDSQTHCFDGVSNRRAIRNNADKPHSRLRAWPWYSVARIGQYSPQVLTPL